MSDNDDIETSKRRHADSYTPHHPIPTIQNYRQEKEHRRVKAQEEVGQHGAMHNDRDKDEVSMEQQYLDRQSGADNQGQSYLDEADTADLPQEDQAKAKDVTEDTSQAITGGEDPKQSRKLMQKRKDDRAEREVTDPVTHLPVLVHDMTNGDFENVPKNEPPVSSDHRTMTDIDATSKSTESLQQEARETQQSHSGLQRLFPPPNFDAARAELIRLYQSAFTIGLGLIIGALVVLLLIEKLSGFSQTIQSSIVRHQSSGNFAFAVILLGVGLGLGSLIMFGMRQWVENKVKAIWETELWEAERQDEKHMQGKKASESPHWLNALLASIWPLINPDLFTSLADTLEVSNSISWHMI